MGPTATTTATTALTRYKFLERNRITLTLKRGSIKNKKGKEKVSNKV